MLCVGTWNIKEEGSESERMRREKVEGKSHCLMQTQACEYIATIQCNKYCYIVGLQ